MIEITWPRYKLLKFLDKNEPCACIPLNAYGLFSNVLRAAADKHIAAVSRHKDKCRVKYRLTEIGRAALHNSKIAKRRAEMRLE